MNNSFKRSPIGTGAHFSHILDKKFKQNLITVSFIMPLDPATASNNAAVPYILRKGCRECPDFSDLNAKLNELYGANMSTSVSKINGYQVLGLSIGCLDSRFALDGEDINGQCASLLASVIFDPKVAGNAFDEQDTATERQYIIDSIESEINEKRTYAVSRCIQIMCAGEPVAVRRYGELETAKKITGKSAYNAYKNIIETANIEISFTGPGDPASAKEAFSSALAKISRNPSGFELLPLKTTADTIKEETETMALNQSKLVLGMRVGSIENSDEMYAMRLCAALLGGTPFSKFFLNVREKLSLCYYCAASFNKFNKLLMIDSGIEKANKQKAQDEILKQIEAVQNGDISDEELANTKLLAINSLNSVTDSPSAMDSWYFSQTVMKQAMSPKEEAAMLDAVTKEQIVAAAKKITLDTVYFLTGSDE